MNADDKVQAYPQGNWQRTIEISSMRNCNFPIFQLFTVIWPPHESFDFKDDKPMSTKIGIGSLGKLPTLSKFCVKKVVQLLDENDEAIWTDAKSIWSVNS